jgi:hypothetical protein
MPALFTALASLFTPLFVLLISVTVIVALLLGCIANPSGAVNQFVCTILDLIAFVLPSTPPQFRVATILQSASNSMPLIGYGVVNEIYNTASGMFLISVAVRIYKLIPFKAS